MPFLILFAACWSALVLIGDCSIGHDYYQQYESGRFLPITGTITHSELQTHTTSKGTYYTYVINYLYKVGGQTFVGDRLAYGEDQTAVLAGAETLVKDHPVGSVVQVYYNSRNPNDAVLYPGLGCADFGWVLGLTPFNIVMMGFWVWIGGWLRLRIFKPEAGGVKMIEDGVTLRIRLPRWEPIWWGLVTTGGLAFVAIPLLKFTGNMGRTGPMIAVVYLAGMGVYVWRRWKADSGGEDLIMSEAAGTMELPVTFGRKERVTVRFRDVDSLWVETIVRGGSKGTTYTFAPTLRIHGNQLGPQKLAEWSDPVKAYQFTNWLGGKARISTTTAASSNG